MKTRTLRSIRAFLAVLACAAFAAPLQAGTNSVGVQLHFPVPGRDIGDRELGAGVGVTFTLMDNANVGFGLDVVQHYWPASAGYRAAFDRYLRATRVETLAGSNWAFAALQMTGHLKFTTPKYGRYAPWLKVGGGLYRVNYLIDEQRPEGTYAWVVGEFDNISTNPGGYAGMGLDVHASSMIVLGVDGAFHYLWSGEGSSPGYRLPGFSAVTAGMRVMYEW